ncbi:MAG: zinc ribbon domain-containing protein [Aquificaceae bacterium]|nr:transposase [Aquificaceae bacterium]MDW8433396.1 zinc ribbon domain-containing protein [Aquificaceae bacterium]
MGLEIKNKLRGLQEEHGIEVVYVNPAYGFQAFSGCGYVDKESRKSRSEFECKLCGKKLQAGVNASRNLLDHVRWECVYAVFRKPLLFRWRSLFKI